MQNSTNMRILELLRFLYERTDENHPATVSDIIAHLNGKEFRQCGRLFTQIPIR